MTETRVLSRHSETGVQNPSKKVASITREFDKENLINAKRKDNHNVRVRPALPKVLTIKQAEQFLCISHSAMYDLLNGRKIRNYYVGRRRYITRDAVLDFISNQESEVEYA